MFFRATLAKSTSHLFPRFMSTSTLLADRQAAIARLEAKTFFNQLSKNEKLYAHYMAKASFAGSRIIITQANPRGPEIFDLIQSIFTTKDGKMTDIEQLHKDRYVMNQYIFESLNTCN
jgi:dipeptidyl-peptidase-3